ncbi:MAG: alpha/beta hydrolase [Pirellulaceae bacterium]|nr:alpha/beta hydrolase [Pirellulaceae bacterium]
MINNPLVQRHLVPWLATAWFCAITNLVALMPMILPSSVHADGTIERNVEYLRRETVQLLADIYQPTGDGPFSGVLMVHGGAWMSGNKSHVVQHAKRFMRRGYVVVAINYRLAPRHKFPAQLEDCRAALRWMRSNSEKYRIDPTEIAGFGYSAGGQLVCLLGLNPSEDHRECLQAIIAGGAPCEFRQIPESSKALAYWLGSTRRDRPDIYRNASPTSFVTSDDPPVFLFHGASDSLVRSSSSLDLYQRLQDKGVESKMHMVADSGHLKTFFDPESSNLAVEFLDEALGSAVQKQVAP